MNKKVLEIWKSLSNKSELPKNSVFVKKIIFDIVPVGKDDLCIGGSLRRVFILDSSTTQVHLLIPIVKGISSENLREQNSYHLTLLCSKTPYYPVEQIELSNSGQQLALIGPNEVDIIDLTSLPLIPTGNERQLTCRSYRIYKSVKPSTDKVVSVKWHPGRTNCLLVLTNDEKVLVYETDFKASARTSSDVSAMHPTIIYPLNNNSGLSSTKLKKVDISSSPSAVSQALRETCIDLTVAEPLLDSENEDDWPILVLRGTGEVLVLTGLFTVAAEMRSHQVAPMVPPAEDNYGTDFSAVLCLRGSPNLVVLASTTGQLIHALLLAGPTLCVVDRCDLDLGQFSTAEISSDQPVVWLERDIYTPCVYHCVHEMGVHRVVLAWLSKLRHFYTRSDTEDRSSRLPALTPSTLLDFVVCTRPLPSAPSLVLVGLAILRAGPRLHLVGLSSTNQLLEVELRGESAASPVSPVKRTNDTEIRNKKTEYNDDFLNHMQQILRHDGCSVPVFRVPKDLSGGGIDERECVELIVQVTEALRTGSMARLDLARDEWCRRVALVECQREFQENEMTGLKTECEQLTRTVQNKTRRLEATAERLEGLQGRFSDLATRMTGINGKLSRSELEAKEEVTRIARTIDSNLRSRLSAVETRLVDVTKKMEIVGLDRRRSARSLQAATMRRHQLGRTALTPEKTEKVATILRDEGNQLQALVQKVKTLSLGIANL